jgi:hypothetical protein
MSQDNPLVTASPRDARYALLNDVAVRFAVDTIKASADLPVEISDVLLARILLSFRALERKRAGDIAADWPADDTEPWRWPLRISHAISEGAPSDPDGLRAWISERFK